MIYFWIVVLLMCLFLLILWAHRKSLTHQTAKEKLMRQILRRSRKVHRMMIRLAKQERKVIRAKQEAAQLIHKYRTM